MRVLTTASHKRASEAGFGHPLPAGTERAGLSLATPELGRNDMEVGSVFLA